MFRLPTNRTAYEKERLYFLLHHGAVIIYEEHFLSSGFYLVYNFVVHQGLLILRRGGL